MKNLILTIVLLFSAFVSFAQVYKDPKAPVEDRVKDVLSRLTLIEKIDYIGGTKDFYIRAIERLGLPQIKLSDGPVGVRNDGNSTAYPAGILSASTWDIDLAYKLGIALGNDARSRGVHILLGPGVNIFRAPMCGRNFEYFGEDPFLSGEVAAAYIQGVQSKGVVATVKHFAANNQEWDRHFVSSDVDERTMQEIYLPAFKTAVLKGKVGAIMDSYNLLNGEYTAQNSHLNNDILKRDWKFDGIVMSDWGSIYDGLAAYKGGLDLEMPFAAFMNQATLLPAIQNGTLSAEVLDDKVRRILRIIFRFGFYDNVQLDSSIPKDNPASATVALNLARGGIVLLKNIDNILPLSQSKIKTLAVIGPNAEKYIAGGGSSYTICSHNVPILQGIKNLVGNNVTINYSAGILDAGASASKSIYYNAKGSLVKGLKGEYFNNKTFSGTAVYTRTDTMIDYHWATEPNVSGMPADNFSVRWTGVVRPLKNGFYKFTVRGDDGFRLWINNQLVIDQWVDQGATIIEKSINLTAGVDVPIKLEYFENGGSAEITFGWRDLALSKEAAKLAANSDVAIVCVGFNADLEGEGVDRDFILPDGQDSLILAVAKANPNTIVILNGGGNVAMEKWIDKVKGLVHAFYPGQEGGTAVAEILFGITNPSGKLTTSFEKKWEDNPTFNSYFDINKTKHVKYTEGVFVGYRYYDSKNVEPLFPFGFGLSYTSFTYSNMKITGDGKSANKTITFDVTNSGSCSGSEVAQVYVHQVECQVPRPFKELKGFAKAALNKGETKTITIKLNSDAFSYYKTSTNSFGMDAGKFEILVGSSSKDIRLRDFVMQTK